MLGQVSASRSDRCTAEDGEADTYKVFGYVRVQCVFSLAVAIIKTKILQWETGRSTWFAERDDAEPRMKSR